MSCFFLCRSVGRCVPSVADCRSGQPARRTAVSNWSWSVSHELGGICRALLAACRGGWPESVCDPLTGRPPAGPTDQTGVCWSDRVPAAAAL